MEQRQDPENGVARPDRDELEHSVGLGQQIAVGQHHAFGVAGGARRIKDDRHIVGPDIGRPEVLRTSRYDVVEAGNVRCVRRPRLMLQRLQALLRGTCREFTIKQHQADVVLLRRGTSHREMPSVNEQNAAAAIFEQSGDLLGLERSVQRHRNVSRAERAQVGCHPPRTIAGQHGTARAALNTVLR